MFGALKKFTWVSLQSFESEGLIGRPFELIEVCSAEEGLDKVKQSTGVTHSGANDQWYHLLTIPGLQFLRHLVVNQATRIKMKDEFLFSAELRYLDKSERAQKPEVLFQMRVTTIHALIAENKLDKLNKEQDEQQAGKTMN